VRWVEGVRFAEDGRFITSANLLTGIDATLAAVARTAGREAAARAAVAVAHPLPDEPGRSMAFARPWLDPLTLLHVALRWNTPEVGLRLAGGADEMAVAAGMDLLTATYSARVIPVADAPVVESRHGLRLLVAAAPAGGLGEPLDTSAATDAVGRPVHAAMLERLAALRGSYFARRTAEQFGYGGPWTPGQASSGTVRVVLLTLLLAGVGFCLPLLVGRARAARVRRRMP
jgi:hypothetical protein